VKTIKTFAFNASILALALGVTSQTAQANPNNQNSEYIDNITLTPSGGIYPNMVVLRNSATNKQIDALNVTLQNSHIDIDMSGSVACQKDKEVDYFDSRAFFGPASLFVETVLTPKALYDAPFFPSNKKWEGISGWGVTESGDGQPFSVPLAQIKNGDPAVRFDPIAELNAKLQQHLGSGGTKLDFYKSDHIFTVKRPITLASTCRKYVSPGKTTPKSGYETKMMDLTIKYEGDPNLRKVGVLNAQLGGNLPQQINQNLPMQLNSATFQPNMPHHIGQCPAKQDPKIRINYKGSGEGQIRFMIYDGSKTVYGSGALSFNSKNSGGNGYHDFIYPFNALLKTTIAWKQINKTTRHPFKIRAQIKDKDAVTWGSWSNYGQADWNHRCTPTTKFGTPGSLGGFKGGNIGNTLTIKPSASSKSAPRATIIKRAK